MALAARFAHAHGYIDSDTMLRVVVMNGLMVAHYGNRIPKAVLPSAWARQSRRFSGRALVLSGLVYAGLWAFAPIPLAATFRTGVVLLGVVASLSYCFWLRTHARAGA